MVVASYSYIDGRVHAGDASSKRKHAQLIEIINVMMYLQNAQETAPVCAVAEPAMLASNAHVAHELG